MATTNLDSADLKAVLSAPGLIREDVLNKIWDISSIPLPFSDRVGFSGSVDNSYTEWTTDKLRDPSLTNFQVDGSAQDTANDTNTGARLGNHCQISTKTVQVSSRADESDVIGRDRELAYQIMMRQRELRRDREATSLNALQGSQADDGGSTPGKAGSVFSFIKTNVSLGATGTSTGFNTSTKVTAAVVPGTKRALTETIVRDIAQAVYEKNGDPTAFMARTPVIRKFSEYCFTASARIATLTSETGQSQTSATAKGSVNVFVTDFGVVLDLIPNRLMPITATGTSSVLIADWSLIEGGELRGLQVEPLAKKGLAEVRMMSVDWTLKVLNEEGLGAIHAIDETLAVTQ